ncbi:MAG: diguanylate cyclase [Gammaproteobacteria bacterium]|nr:diguanylate cyclase [Gammaproteobacteria bacterium]
MGLQQKLALSIFLLTVTAFFTFVGLFYKHNREAAISTATKELQTTAIEQSDRLDNFLQEKIKITTAIFSADLVYREAEKSNRKYRSLSLDQRQSMFKNMDHRWRNTPDPDDPFVQSFIKNPAGSYLTRALHSQPGEYGELFFTNRYGLIVGTSNKLTNLYHNQKYWWANTYNNNVGKIFIDDRGYDESVQGYVVGIVLPIIKENQVIAVAKGNINLVGPFSDLIYRISEHGNLNAIIARSDGLIVIDNSARPVSSMLPATLAEKFRYHSPGSLLTNMNGKNQLVSYAPVLITLNSTDIRFGGSQTESSDHSFGNRGESWFLVISKDLDSVLAPSVALTQWVIVTGLTLCLLIGIASMFLAKRLATPILTLIRQAETLGKGNLDARVDATSSDELGTLAQSFNDMANNLKKITVSKDELTKEVELRQKLESELWEQSVKDYLTGLYNRRGFRKIANTHLDTANKDKHSHYLIYTDVDNLKFVNDTMGHKVGDDMLTDIAAVLSSAFRESDIIGRVGGDEFAILLHDNKNSEDVKSIEARLHNSIKEFNSKNKRPYQLSISAGVIKCDFSQPWSLDEAMSTADSLMYKTKNRKKIDMRN